MDEYESLSHTRWDCKYYVAFIPKCRRKACFRREENCLEVLRQSAGLARAAASLFARNEIDAKFGRRAAGKQSRMLRSFFERADCA